MSSDQHGDISHSGDVTRFFDQRHAVLLYIIHIKPDLFTSIKMQQTRSHIAIRPPRYAGDIFVIGVTQSVKMHHESPILSQAQYW